MNEDSNPLQPLAVSTQSVFGIVLASKTQRRRMQSQQAKTFHNRIKYYACQIANELCLGALGHPIASQVARKYTSNLLLHAVFVIHIFSSMRNGIEYALVEVKYVSAILFHAFPWNIAAKCGHRLKMHNSFVIVNIYSFVFSSFFIHFGLRSCGKRSARQCTQ